MKSARYSIAALILAAGIAAPAIVSAAPVPQVRAQVRIYDKEHKDYHNWDDREERSWNQYLTENHRKPHVFTKANSRERGEYWKWRHDHPDSDDRR